MTQIKKLHHCAFRCRDTEETRRFYEEFLELKLVKALKITTTKTSRTTEVLHTFYKLGDGSSLAFFEDPTNFFEFKKQRDFDLHIALEVDNKNLIRLFKKGKASNIETRGIINHGFIQSAYFRDPNGYVIELSVPNPRDKKNTDKEIETILNDWKKMKPESVY
tara:strand:- start:73 stop:561 length:489 start_codon:yes stop_codon:yes gene_type:complete